MPFDNCLIGISGVEYQRDAISLIDLGFLLNVSYIGHTSFKDCRVSSMCDLWWYGVMVGVMYKLVAFTQGILTLMIWWRTRVRCHARWKLECLVSAMSELQVTITLWVSLKIGEFSRVSWYSYLVDNNEEFMIIYQVQKGHYTAQRQGRFNGRVYWQVDSLQTVVECTSVGTHWLNIMGVVGVIGEELSTTRWYFPVLSIFPTLRERSLEKPGWRRDLSELRLLTLLKLSRKSWQSLMISFSNFPFFYRFERCPIVDILLITSLQSTCSPKNLTVWFTF